MIRAFAVAAFLLTASSAEAQGRRPMSAMEEIDSRCGGPTPVAQQCAARILDREDARLNRVYQAALSRMKRPQQDQLRREQRQWIVDRDEECDAEYEQGGTQAGIQATACRAFATQVRADELERMARSHRPR